MVIAGDIDILIDFFSFTALPWYAVKLKKSIRLPISQAITMAML
jgi:hypothetical protein